jgi:hypothetical protein
LVDFKTIGRKKFTSMLSRDNWSSFKSVLRNICFQKLLDFLLLKIFSLISLRFLSNRSTFESRRIWVQLIIDHLSITETLYKKVKSSLIRSILLDTSKSDFHWFLYMPCPNNLLYGIRFWLWWYKLEVCYWQICPRQPLLA